MNSKKKKKTESKYKIHYFLAQTKPALNFLMVKCLDSKIHEFPSCFTKGEKKKKKKKFVMLVKKSLGPERRISLSLSLSLSHTARHTSKVKSE